MPLMRRDVDERAGLHFDHTILESQSSRTLQQHDELVLGLIVSKAFG